MAGFGDPITQVAFSIHENKGVFALLLGSGVSRAAEIPTGWEITLDLVRRVAEAEGGQNTSDWGKWYVETEGKQPDYSDLLGKLATTQSERRQILHSYIEPDESDREEGRKLPTNAHKAIARLVRGGHIRVILTTNFDRLMENALREEGIEPTVVSSVDTFKGAEPLTHSQCYIFKVHGDYKDTRILNTENELAGYPAEFDYLLDRIFDEYGLVICGWSGEWDTALRSAITRTPNRRYPIFWASRGSLGEKAQTISSLRGGIEIPITDADTFFEELSEKVTTLDEIRRKNPVEVDIVISRAKRYLAKPDYRIQYSDLLSAEVTRISEKVLKDEMGGQTQWSPDEFRRRIVEYQSVSESFVKVCGIAGVWGDENFLRYTMDAITSLWEISQPETGGINYFLNIRAYPAVLALQALSIALIQSRRYSDLRKVFDAPVWTTRDAEAQVSTYMLPLVWPGGKKEIWRNFPEYERRHAPLSDHLFDYFEANSSAFLGLKKDIKETYLLSEILSALAYLDQFKLSDLEAKLEGEELGRTRIWPPVAGKIGWDYWATKPIFDRLETDKFTTDLANAGFGNGSPKTVAVAAKYIQRAIAELHWH